MGASRSEPILGLVWALAAFVACSGDDDGSGRGSGVATGGTTGAGGSGTAVSVGGRPDETTSAEGFLAAWAGAVCALYRPCCEGTPKGFDAAGCERWLVKVQGAFWKGEVDGAKAATCLGALRAAVGDDARCRDVHFDEATYETLCEGVLLPPLREGQPPGGACKQREDCAGSHDGYVDCQLGLCRLYATGTTAGATPCEIRKDASPPTTTIWRCDAASGLYCDRQTNACAPFVGDGERCPEATACGPSGMCIGGTCKTKPGDGAPCLNAVPGAGGFCADGFTCNVQSLVCEPRPKDDVGQRCTGPDDCLSKSCDVSKGTCAAYDFTKYLNCTGG